MSLDLDKIEAAARAAISDCTPGNWRHHEGWNGKVFDGDEGIADCNTGADASFIASVAPLVALEMIALIRRQEKELAEAREACAGQVEINNAYLREIDELKERRGEPSAVRVVIVGREVSRLPVVPASDPLPPHTALIDHGPTLRMHMAFKYGSPAQDERRQGVDMVDHRLRQILNPPAPFHGEKWAAADALYWLTGDQAFADQADGLAAESLKGDKS